MSKSFFLYTSDEKLTIEVNGLKAKKGNWILAHRCKSLVMNNIICDNENFEQLRKLFHYDEQGSEEQI
jgi:hypothetical protein